MSACSHHQSDSAGFEPAAVGAECSADCSVAPLRVVELPLERLRLWPENPRTIRPDRLEELKRAMLADREMLLARPLLALRPG
jgi:hypothetical protein